MPDIDKIGDIATLLGVTCDYLLKDEIETEQGTSTNGNMSAMLLALQGKQVKLNFYEDEADIDLYDAVCMITGFEGNWMKVSATDKKGKTIEKVIPISSVLSIDIIKEE